MTFAAALVAAKRALDGHDDEAALVALVAAWRVNKQPRIADVVDRVSARIGAAPIEGKTVKARTAAWSTLARKRRTLDVGPLVATPWPGTWKDALPLVELACALPPDPRVAVALAQLVGDERFDTWTARRFFQRVLARITSLGDVRTRSILEAAVGLPRSRYWRDDTKPAVLATIAKLRDLPKLTKSDETAVVAIEACFAETVATERTHARGRAELLAAIYADPDDDTVRSVFADWLTEQGDPQGELIALQLARHRGEQGDRKRELALLRKHAEAWAGPLGSIVTLDRRTFERGFLADVTVDVARISDDFDDPAWATVHTVEVTRTAIPVLTAPALARVRCWRGLTEVDAVELARLGTWPRIDELEVRLAPVASLDRGRILDGVAFPNLRRIAIVADDAYTPIAMLDPARPLERVTVLPRLDRLATVVGLAQRFPIAEVAVGGNRHDRDWLLTMRRDAAGRLTRLHGAPLAGDALLAGSAGHRQAFPRQILFASPVAQLVFYQKSEVLGL